MEHVLWVLIMVIVNVGGNGEPNAKFIAHTSFVSKEECSKKGNELSKNMPQGSFMSCVPVKHGMYL